MRAPAAMTHFDPVFGRNGLPRPRRVLIYRLGSIGDTMVALPALRLIARRFPDAERVLLTGTAPVNGASMAALLAGSDLIHRTLEYRPGERRPAALWRLASEIRALRADILIYLTEPKGRMAIWRDVAFFRVCGIKRIVGAPLARDLAENRRLPGGELRESEAARLARCLAVLGDARLGERESWTPFIPGRTLAEADGLLDRWNGGSAFVVLAPGARAPAKDWGEANWAALLRRLEEACPGLGLMLVAGPDDRPRIERLMAGCRAPVFGWCGDLGVSMALLRRSSLAIVHDGGPMHIAAGLGVPTVAIFSGHAEPGVWFPAGSNHTVLYHPVPCSGCGLWVCTDHGGVCLRSITIERVFEATMERLGPLLDKIRNPS